MCPPTLPMHASWPQIDNQITFIQNGALKALVNEKVCHYELHDFEPIASCPGDWLPVSKAFPLIRTVALVPQAGRQAGAPCCCVLGLCPACRHNNNIKTNCDHMQLALRNAWPSPLPAARWCGRQNCHHPRFWAHGTELH